MIYTNYTVYYVIIIIIISVIKSYLKKSIIDIFTDKEYLLLNVVLNLIAILIYYLFTNYNNMFTNLTNIYNKYFYLDQTNHIKLIIISILPIITYHYMSKLKDVNNDIYKSLL